MSSVSLKLKLDRMPSSLVSSAAKSLSCALGHPVRQSETLHCQKQIIRHYFVKWSHFGWQILMYRSKTLPAAMQVRTISDPVSWVTVDSTELHAFHTAPQFVLKLLSTKTLLQSSFVHCAWFRSTLEVIFKLYVCCIWSNLVLKFSTWRFDL